MANKKKIVKKKAKPQQKSVKQVKHSSKIHKHSHKQVHKVAHKLVHRKSSHPSKHVSSNKSIKTTKQTPTPLPVQKQDSAIIEKVKSELEAMKEKEKKINLEKLSQKEIKEILESVIQNKIEDLFFKLKESKEEQANFIIQELSKKVSEQRNRLIFRLSKENPTKSPFIQALKNEIIASYLSTKEDLDKECSYLRKRGDNLLLEEAKLTRAAFKLKLFRATEEKSDLEKAKKEISDASKAITPRYEQVQKDEEKKL